MGRRELGASRRASAMRVLVLRSLAVGFRRPDIREQLKQADAYWCKRPEELERGATKPNRFPGMSLQ
jgi:hypothetical protein